MDSKLAAAQTVTESGEAMIVADGRMNDILPRLLNGEELGTLFVPSPKKRSARSRWIGAARPVGAVVVDGGAARAIAEMNKSLIPAGIVSVEGPFDRGDLIAVKTSDGTMIARGLTNYASSVVEQIRGKKTTDVRAMRSEERR